MSRIMQKLMILDEKKEVEKISSDKCDHWDESNDN
jgi:hypothetical protein